MESDDKTMKRVNLIAPFQMRCEDVAEPEPGRGEVKFKPIQIGICGSDMLAFHGKHKYVTLPHVMGHECVGVVEAIGENVSEFHVGDLLLYSRSLCVEPAIRADMDFPTCARTNGLWALMPMAFTVNTMYALQKTSLSCQMALPSTKEC